MKINLHPKVCNICGGKVEYIQMKRLYGSYLKYGEKSGWCYHCKNCDATVGTHIDDPKAAFGLLADEKMRELRQRNHAMFDKFWKNKKQRSDYYNKLAEEMGISPEECHFSWFSVEELEKSYQIMLRWWREKYDK